MMPDVDSPRPSPPPRPGVKMIADAGRSSGAFRAVILTEAPRVAVDAGSDAHDPGACRLPAPFAALHQFSSPIDRPEPDHSQRGFTSVDPTP